MAQCELLRLVPQAPPALCAILEGGRGPVPPPIRSEIFGLQRFAQHGRSLGETHRAAKAKFREAVFFPRLRDNIRTLREAHHYIGVQAATGYDISPAAEWLLDNFYLIEAQLDEVHKGLPRSYFRALPVLVDEPLAGLPRVYGVAWAFVAHTDGAFDEDLLVQFLCAYQETRELTLAEVWALPTTLRVVLIENLRRLAERVATNKAAREVANRCCDRLESCTTPLLDELLTLLDQRGVGHVFMAQMAQRLQDRRTTGDAADQAHLHDWLQRRQPDALVLLVQQRAEQAADNLSVSNAVTSLRAIGDADWPDIVARASALMRLMLTSPVFEAEHVRTRDQTLHGIERLSRRSGRSELVVAQTLLDQMHGGDSDDARTVASHWLDGAGRAKLAHALGLHERMATHWLDALRPLALPAYLASLLLGTAGVVAWMLLHPGGASTNPEVTLGLALLAAVLMSFPASEAVVAIVHRLVSESTRPRSLPRLALVNGIPASQRVMVVIPALLTDAASTATLVHRLRLHHLANPERHAQFALLSDWADADAQHALSDEALLADAVQQVRALNAAHPPPPADDDGSHGAPAPRFIVLHRERRFSLTERRWIGWERKRGKLEQLIALLATGTPGAFLDLGEASRVAADTRHILTLDSDTELPPGRLRELVGVATHPHNQPRLDADGRRVVAGYGIVQPRVVTPLPAPRQVTHFHWLFAGQCGVDPYSNASSEVYQDLFSEGSYTGKGLLNVQAMHAVLAGHLPEGLVLSHDLVEGSIVRCAAASEITVIEDAPFHADVAAARVHRWMRGDWQLLPILLRPRRYPLAAINRWKMLDNLRRSLVAPTSLALVLLALATGVVTPWSALALVLAAFSAGPLMGAVAGFSPSRDDLAKAYFYRQAANELARALGGGLWHVAQLLQHALMATDAIVRALYRMAVSRRHLMQWTTTAASHAQAKDRLPAVLRKHWSEPVVALVLLAALLAAGTPWPAWAALLCALWAAAPVTTWWVSRRAPARLDGALSAADRHHLEGIAHDTWRFFERCVGPDDRHLPPDNLQTTPHEMVAHRTSPTNIGLYLLSVACARRFGWIDTAQMAARLQATLATLATLQRYRGHFLNWYDTQSGMPLLPMYVSTVDSGNLSGHLLAVAQACLEAARETPDPPLHARLQAMAHDCEVLAWSAEFGFLYHRKRHLFHIGFRVAEQQLDAGFYDLLASESRLTSLLAIAKGEVPVSHWASLGRPFYAVGTQVGLRSWSGSMFEYLMPSLVLDEPHGSVLREAGCAALREQVAFAHAHGVPWGISESAYAASDHTLAYQYAPQGVPRLALRRTPPDEVVIAPYATALAAQVAPHRAGRNFARLEALGARGAYGFIDALDFTPSRQTDSAHCTPVATFMAHHQGMSLVALTNTLLDGVVQRWGMANPHIEAVASLLHERAPREVSQLRTPPAVPAPLSLQRRTPGLLREVQPGATAVEPTHVLGNGRYSVALRANGAGWSRWGSSGITRWRDDALRDAQGSFFYLRWAEAAPGAAPRAPVAPLYSITQHPAPDPQAQYKSLYHADRVCFDAAWPDLQAHTTVWVSPEDDIEFRVVELHNQGDAPLDIELISAFDVTLADPRADEAHPAFSNLFVRATWLAEHQALWFERTPRLATERGLQAAHFLAESDPQVVRVRAQTDRQRWLGRNQDATQPRGELDELPPAPDGVAGATTPLDTGLDPVCALGVQLHLAPQAQARLVFATAASDDGAVLDAVIDKYRQPSHVQRASLMSATLSGIRLRSLSLGPESFAAIQKLTSALVQSLTRPQAGVAGEVCDRRLLWRFGISGDRPLILVSAGVVQGLGLLRSLAQALRLWAWGGVACDLVVVNAEPASYQMALQHELTLLRERHLADTAAPGANHSTSLHLLRAVELSSDELSTLQSLARVRLHADGRPLLHHVQAWSELHEQAFEERHGTSTSVVDGDQRFAPGASAPTPPRGEFAEPSGEFRFDVSAAQRPLRPWVNVMSNPGFGAQLTEAGGGYTWAVNSRMNQLTAWSNDPVSDPPSEWFVLQDRRTREAWSVAPSSWGGATRPALAYSVVHGQGYSAISHRRGDVEVSATWCIDAQTAVKQVVLRLVNRGPRTQLLRVVGVAEWLMGATRADRNTVHTSLHRQRLPAGKLSALMCTQRDRAGGFGDGTAFLALAGAADDDEDWTCDRRECFDARGQRVLPDHFGQRSGSGLDPCAALATEVDIAPGATVERVFLIGHAQDAAAARQLAAVAATLPPQQRLEQARRRWDTLLGATQVTTPDPLFDAMVNRWLLYQAVSCRLWAKAGFYQAGGAIGFRDQLQDAMALAWAEPRLLREQIVLAASRQFAEGDVQHWWHVPTGAGVRTHFSDDLLWLPYACVRYLQCTGDAALLDEPVPFIEGPPIADGAEDAYYTPLVSADSASVYEHAARAIDRSLRVGAHGLPLMGTGDWNDGMNRVGHEGRGESVWLGWFLCALVADFAPLAHSRGDKARARRWEQAARGWKAALLGPAWDGQWFKRAFFDDGQPLGSHTSDEARIDLVAQAWAVLSHQAPPALQRMALDAVQTHLVDADAGLIRLLHPPLVNATPSAGYIQAYPPGVRENGGQYSHAGVWALMAQAEHATTQARTAEAADLAWRYFTYLNPAHRSRDPQQREAYGIEPYAVAGDIYSQPPYVGRGGWSWYTGAAAWLHRAAIESILGLRLQAKTLSFTPCLPSHWPWAELKLTRAGRTMRFIFMRATPDAALAATHEWSAQLLAPGESLAWTDLAPHTCFVMALQAPDAASAEAAPASPGGAVLRAHALRADGG